MGRLPMSSPRAHDDTQVDRRIDPAGALPRDLPDLETIELPRSPAAERLLALAQAQRVEPSPAVRLDRARVTASVPELDRVEAWARAQERWSTVAEILALRARGHNDAERGELYLAASALAADKTLRFDRALSYAEAARGTRPSRPVLVTLARLYEWADRPVDAAGCIELLLADGAFSRAELPEVARTLWRLARRGDSAFQVVTLRKAVALDRTSASMREALVAALSNARDAWPPHSTALPPSDVEIAAELSDLALTGSLADPRTLDRLRLSLELRDDPDLRDSLYRALLATRRFGELERELRDRVRAAPASERARHLCALGELASRAPWSRLDIAREAYGNALAQDPHEDDAFRWLVRDARTRGDLDTVERLFGRRLRAGSRDLQQRNELRHRALAIWREAEEPDRAVATLADILFEDPDDPQALEAVQDMLEGEDWPDALRCSLAAASSTAGAPDVRAERLARVIDAVQGRGAEPAALLPLYERLAQIAPDRPEVALDLRSMRSRAGADERALALVRSRVESAPTDLARAEALLALGQLHLERSELDEAWTSFERALSIDPVDPQALEALEKMAREPGRQDRLETVLRRRLVSLEAGRSREPGPAATVLVLHQIAERTPDEDEAVTLLSRVLELDPADQAAADEITRILSRRQDHAALGVHLDHRLVREHQLVREQQLGRSGLEAARDLRKRLARLLADDLKEPAAAVARWEEVLRDSPEDLEPIEALAGLYLVMGQPARAIELLNGAVERLPAGPHRTHLLRRIAQSTRDPAAQAVAYRRVLGAAPDDVEALRFVARHYTERGEDRFGRELSLQLAAVATDPAERVAALVRAADQEPPEEALTTLRQALEQDPASPEVLERMEEVARRAGRWREVIESQERQLLQAADPADRLDLAVAIATVWSEKLDQPECAARSLERARRIDPKSARINRQLAALHARLEDWPALARNLRARIEANESPSDKLDAMLELAGISGARLGQHDLSIELYRAAAALAPGRQDLADAVLDAMAAAGAWEPLVAALEVRAEAEDGREERAALQHAICVLHDRAMRRPQAAFEAAVRFAQSLGPTRQTLRLVLHHGTLSGRLQDLVLALEDLSARSPDPASGSLALHLAAQILERDLGEPTRALDHYLEILRRTGAGPETAAAIERLALLHGRTKDWVDAELERERLTDSRAERVAILERVARVEAIGRRSESAFGLLLRAMQIDPDRTQAADAARELAEELDEPPGDELEPAIRGQFRGRLAEIHMKLAAHGAWHLQRASRLYEAIHDRAAFDATAALALASPEDPSPRERLPRLAEEGRRFGELLAVLDELAAVVLDPGARRRIRFDQACLLLDELHRAAPARAILQELLTEDPTLPGLAARAIEAARASGQGSEMARALEDALEQMPSREAVALLRLLADLYTLVLDLPDESMRICEELLALEPEDPRAEEVLLASYPRAAEWAKLAALLWVRCGPGTTRAAPSSREAVQVAEILSNRLGDLTGAMGAWQRAIELDPGDIQALTAYAAVLERVGDWQELARALSLLADAHRPGPEALEVLLRRAKVLADRLGRGEAAIEALERARSLDPGAEAVLHELERLYELTRQDDELMLLRSDAADRIADPERSRGLLLRLAQQAVDLGDLDGAVEAYWRAIAATPDYVPTYGRLREVLERRGSYGQLIDLLVTESGIWTDPAEAASRLCEAADLSSRILHDEDRARQLYRDAFEASDRCRQAIDALADDAERRGLTVEAIKWLEQARRTVFTAEELAGIDRRIDGLTARAPTRILMRDK